MLRYDKSRRHSDAPYFPDDNFPLAPEAVIRAYETYWERTQPSEKTRRKEQRKLGTTNTLISDFCKSHLTPETYDGAMLAPLVERSKIRDLREPAFDALGVYVNESRGSRQDIRFALGLAADQAVLRSFWNDKMQGLYPESDSPWETKPENVRAIDILNVRTELGVNIESHLIAAANSLRWLLLDQEGNAPDALLKARRAESLHAPLSEIIGFDGISMALQSARNLMKYRKIGRSDLIDDARQALEPYGNHEAADERVNEILTAVLGASSHKQVLDHGYQHGILLGEGVATSDDLRLVWRQKTPGSLARKLEGLERGLLPMDIIGATVITDTPYEIGKVLQEVIERIKNDPRATIAAPPPTRPVGLHVRGAAEYIQEVARGMWLDSASALEPDFDVVVSDPTDYHVAKVTFMFQKWGEQVPSRVELQFNTAAHRVEARVGNAAHALLRLAGKPKTDEESALQIAALQEIRSRKNFLGENSLTQQAGERADSLLYKIEARMPRT